MAHAPSIRQCRRPTSAIAGQPFVSRPQADACMGRQDSEWDTLLLVTTNQAFPTDDCQSGHGGWLCMEGEVPGWAVTAAG